MGFEEDLFWIGHASFYVKSELGNIFIDPFGLSGHIVEKADIILITHPHFDHCSMDDIKKIAKEDTKIIAAGGCLNGNGYNVITAAPGFNREINGIGIRAVPAYNKKAERLKFHPRENDWVGYIVDFGDGCLYHAGDTDHISEMDGIEADIALLPIGGTYTMDTEEAAAAAKSIKARLFVPMHYKHLLGERGSHEAERMFESEVGNAKIMTEVQRPDYSHF